MPSTKSRGNWSDRACMYFLLNYNLAYAVQYHFY
jgi:hypothetical protein